MVDALYESAQPRRRDMSEYEVWYISHEVTQLGRDENGEMQCRKCGGTWGVAMYGSNECPVCGSKEKRVFLTRKMPDYASVDKMTKKESTNA